MDFEETNEYIFINNNKVLAIKQLVDFLRICENLNNDEKLSQTDLDLKNKIINSYKIVLLDNPIYKNMPLPFSNDNSDIMHNYIMSDDLFVNNNFECNYDDHLIFYFKKWLRYNGQKTNNNNIIAVPNHNIQNIQNIQIDLSNLYLKEFVMNDNINFKNDIIFPTDIKLIKLSNNYNNNIVNINNTQCEYLTMGKLFNKKICLPDTIVYLEIGINFDKEIFLPNKLKYLVLHNNNNNIIDYLPNNVEYLKLYYYTLDHKTNNYNLNDLPNSIKTLSIDEQFIINNNISYLPQNIKCLEIFSKNSDIKINHDEYFCTNDNFLNLIKHVNYNVIFLDKYKTLVCFIDNLLELYLICKIMTNVDIILLNLTENIIIKNILMNLLKFSILYYFPFTKNILIQQIISIMIILQFDKINKYNLYLTSLLNNYKNYSPLYIKNKILQKFKIYIFYTHIIIYKLYKQYYNK